MTDPADDWISDANGNRCSVSYFGSREAAQTALDSLKNCRNCTNCSDCSDCSRCSRCSDCSDCSDCSGCSRCSGCSGCSGCSRCSRCSGCSGCSGCSRCSGCSDCSDCSRCSHVAYLNDRVGIQADPTVKNDVGAPAIPRIDNIHTRIYDAVSRPQALNMGTWHSCETTHCRAGWVVTLAGEAGRKLEAFHNTELAAMLIYRESGYHINPARFYDGNEAAMNDMQRLAQESAS